MPFSHRPVPSRKQLLEVSTYSASVGETLQFVLILVLKSLQLIELVSDTNDKASHVLKHRSALLGGRHL